MCRYIEMTVTYSYKRLGSIRNMSRVCRYNSTRDLAVPQEYPISLPAWPRHVQQKYISLQVSTVPVIEKYENHAIYSYQTCC